MSLGAFPPLEFYELVWEELVWVLLRLLGQIHLWRHLVRGFCLLGVFFITTSISLGVIYLSDSLILPDLFLEDYMFLGIYPFHPGCPACSHITAHNIFLQSFVFLWCLLLFLLFHFWFYLFGSFLSFSRWVWLKVCWYCLSF